MNEKSKLCLKRVILLIIVFALGITVGIFSLKSTEKYKNTFHLSERLTFDSYQVITSLDSAFDNNLPKDRIFEDLSDLCFVSSLAIGSDGAFFVGYDENLSYEELNVLFNCSIKAKFIAKDLVSGREVSEADLEWLEKFDSAIDEAYAAHSGPSYRVLIESLVEQNLQPEE